MWDLQGRMQWGNWSKRTQRWPFTPSVRSSGHFLPKCLIATLPPPYLLCCPHWKYHLAIRMAWGNSKLTLLTDASFYIDFYHSFFNLWLKLTVIIPGIAFLVQPAAVFCYSWKIPKDCLYVYIHCSNMALSGSYRLVRLTLSKVNTIMCSLGSASWLLGRHVCSVIRACQKQARSVEWESVCV